MKPKITFKEILEICRVYVDNKDNVTIPVGFECNIEYSSNPPYELSFKFKPKGTLSGEVNVLIKISKDTDDEFILTYTQSKYESSILRIPINVNTDSYKSILTVNLSGDMYRLLVDWYDIIDDIRLWYNEYTADPEMAKEIYYIIKAMSPEFVRSLVTRKVITEEEGGKFLVMRNQVVNGLVYPNLGHCIE